MFHEFSFSFLTVQANDSQFFVFHERGISVYDPTNCRLQHQIQATDIIPGTQVITVLLMIKGKHFSTVYITPANVFFCFCLLISHCIYHPFHSYFHDDTRQIQRLFWEEKKTRIKRHQFFPSFFSLPSDLLVFY